MTLTLRHDRSQSLAELWGALSKCWAAVHRSAAWRGGARTVGDCASFGIEGWIKVTEVTHGKHGWHTHLHVAILTGEPLSAERAEFLGARVFGRWSAAAVRAGLAAPSPEHGVDVRVVGGSQSSAASIAVYLTKAGIGGVSAELMGGTAGTKIARAGNRSPWQIAAGIAAAIEAGGDPDPVDLKVWRAWEQGSRGRRQIAWSKGLKERLAVVEQDDESIAAAEDDGVVVAQISPAQWRRLRHEVGAILGLLGVVERARTEAEAVEAAAAWLGDWAATGRRRFGASSG